MGELNQILSEIMEAPPMVSIFSLFHVSQSIVVSWCVMAVLVIGSMLLTRNLRRVPGKTQVVLEMGIGFVYSFCTEHLGKYGKIFAPWLGTLVLYILGCNLSGLIGVPPPTKDLTITITLALMSMLLIYGGQLCARGLKKGLKRFAEPFPFLLPFNVIDMVTRPLSLCMRLFGNILAGYLIMEMIKFFVPFFVPVVFSLYFDLFEGLMQAAVFVFLTTLFFAEAIKDDDE